MYALASLALLASQITAPTAQGAADRLLSPADVPIKLLQEDRPYPVLLRAIVEPSGAMRDCEIGRSSGDSKVDAYTCVVVAKRLKFAPARDATGAPLLGVYRAYISWWVGEGSPPPPDSADIDLDVNSLPAGVPSPVIVPLAIQVEADGRVSSCASSPYASIPSLSYDPALVRIACDQMLKSFKAFPARDASGKFARSIQSATVQFKKARR